MPDSRLQVVWGDYYWRYAESVNTEVCFTSVPLYLDDSRA